MLRSSVRSALTAPEEGSTDSSLNSLRNIQEDQSSTLHDGYQIITQESQTDQRLSSLTVGEPHRSSLFLPSTTTANAMRLSITPSTTSSIGIEKPKENFFTKKNVVFFFKHNWVLLFYSLISLMVILVLFHLSFFAAKMHDDGNEFEPEFLGCRSWAYGTNCGLNGFDCQPFETTWMAFRCPTRCAWDQATSLAVYGTGKYRADSRICRAAIHAGVIGQNGGCALMRYSGEADSFVGTFTNGVRSRDFPSWFPKTYEFKEAPSIYCTDLSFVILSFGFISLIGYAVLPHTNPQALYLLLMAWGFFYVRLIGQPRSVNYQDIAMDSFGEIFVLLATCYCVYYMAPVYTFSIWSNHRTKKQRLLYWGLYYVVPFHLVLHMNYVAFIPWLNIDLGGYNNEHINAGTYIVYGLIFLFLLVCGLSLCRQLYRQKIWPRFVVIYLVLFLSLLLSWLMFTQTDFHLHHTMLGIILVPFTRFTNPLATAGQAAALGCFIQGYAAWGWSAYLSTRPVYQAIQVPEEPPHVLNVSQSSVHLTWIALEQVVGYSVEINGVEMYRGMKNYTLIENLKPNMTYFMTVAGVTDWGTDGKNGPKGNFTTLP